MAEVFDCDEQLTLEQALRSAMCLDPSGDIALNVVADVIISEIASTLGSHTAPALVAVTDTLIQALNTDRLGLTLYNNSSEDIYIKMGSGASNTSFTVKMPPDFYWEMPFKYTGVIHAYCIPGIAIDLLQVNELT